MPPATDKETTCALSQGSDCRHESVAVSVVAPDPCRGWGRQRLAHIRAQKEPVVSPAGTGIEHRRPGRVSWRHACRVPGDPSDRTENSLINRLRLRNRAGKHLHPSPRYEPLEGNMPLQKAETCSGYPATGRAMPDNRWESRYGQDVSDVRKSCGARADCGCPDACHRTIRSPRCPCSRGNGYMTRRCRSCRYVAGSRHHIQDRSDPRGP